MRLRTSSGCAKTTCCGDVFRFFFFFICLVFIVPCVVNGDRGFCECFQLSLLSCLSTLPLLLLLRLREGIIAQCTVVFFKWAVIVIIVLSSIYIPWISQSAPTHPLTRTHPLTHSHSLVAHSIFTKVLTHPKTLITMRARGLARSLSLTHARQLTHSREICVRLTYHSLTKPHTHSRGLTRSLTE